MIKYYARFNATDFLIVGNNLSVKDSSREVTFSDLVIDFTGKDESLLPIQYQEITIVQVDESLVESVLMVGYVDLVDYPEFYSASQPFLLTISLLSPYAYACKRTISYSFNNIALRTAVGTILAPLLSDGFTIETNELAVDKFVGRIFQMETIEKIMNYLANAYDFIWYIDKAKKIYLKDIDSTKGIVPILTLTSNNNPYLTTIKPYRTVVDYANKLNMKNLFIVSNYSDDISITQGSEYRFPYPISISKNVCSRYETSSSTMIPFYVEYYSGSYLVAYYIEYTYSTGEFSYDPEGTGLKVGFVGDKDESTFDILLIRDNVDATKILGLKWNLADEDITITSRTQLIPYNVMYSDASEIDNIKDYINTSGVIEKVVDCNGRYFYDYELFNYATSLFKKNSSVTSEINCNFKGRLDDETFVTFMNSLGITELLSINLTDFKISGDFLITSVEKTYGTEDAEIKVNARNFNLNENFNDIFRVNMEELTEEVATTMVVNYCRDNKTLLSKEVYVDGELVNL